MTFHMVHLAYEEEIDLTDAKREYKKIKTTYYKESKQLRVMIT